MIDVNVLVFISWPPWIIFIKDALPDAELMQDISRYSTGGKEYLLKDFYSFKVVIFE
jgi:hypothetical protein